MELTIDLTEPEWEYAVLHVFPFVEGMGALQPQVERWPSGKRRYRVSVAEETADKIVVTCMDRFIAVGLREDDEPNAEGLLLEDIADRFNPAHHGR